MGRISGESGRLHAGIPRTGAIIGQRCQVYVYASTLFQRSDAGEVVELERLVADQHDLLQSTCLATATHRRLDVAR